MTLFNKWVYTGTALTIIGTCLTHVMGMFQITAASILINAAINCAVVATLMGIIRYAFKAWNHYYYTKKYDTKANNDTKLSPQKNPLKDQKNPKDNPILRSVIRHLLHKLKPNNPKNSFPLSRTTPQISANLRMPAKLIKPENKKLLHTILRICGDENGPYVIPMVIDHWTTINNLKNIIKTGAIFGNALLKKQNINFKKNCLTSGDLENLDGNAICFCPVGFVYHEATEGKDRIRLRIDLSKVELPGRYNTFFKIRDFLGPARKLNIKLTDRLSVKFDSQLNLSFIFDGKKIMIPLQKNDLVFYGDLSQINRFCLLFPFIAMEKATQKNYRAHGKKCEGDVKILPLILKHLNSLNENKLKKILIFLAQNLTMVSEYNFNAILPLSSKLIYDIHDPSRNTTYSLADLTSKQYDNTLQSISKNFSSLKSLPQKKEIIKNPYCCHDLYGVVLDNDYGSIKHKMDAKNIKNLSFKHYVETRLGNRFVPPLSYKSQNEPQSKIGVQLKKCK